MSTPTAEKLLAVPQSGQTERTLGQLVADASRDLSTIVRSEVALAKAEVKKDVAAGVTGAAMFLVAGVFALLALLLLLIAAAYGLVAAGLLPWLSFLIVGAALLLIGAVLALVGKSRLSRVRRPERTVRTSKQTLTALKAARG
jgi:ABC-type multidrug transport system fused ATPase/permease subunit